jgi:hypothetical protein
MSEEESQYLEAWLGEHLATDPRIAEPSLRVSIRGRIATVTGSVLTQERRLAVEEVAREILPEGFEIRNETNVEPHAEPGGPEEVS